MGMKVTSSEAVRLMAMRSGMSLAGVSREMKMKMPTNLRNMVSRGSLRADVLADVAKACGYKMVLVPADAEIEDCIEIEGGGVE